MTQTAENPIALTNHNTGRIARVQAWWARLRPRRSEEARMRAALDRVGAPTHDGQRVLDSPERLELLLLRLGGRLQSIVQANTALVGTLQEVRARLSRAPQHFEVRRAIATITETVTAKVPDAS